MYCLENAVEKGIYYTTWVSERDHWMSFALDYPHVTRLINAFDEMWQRIAKSFSTYIGRKSKKVKDPPSEVAETSRYEYEDEVHKGLADMKDLPVCFIPPPVLQE